MGGREHFQAQIAKKIIFKKSSVSAPKVDVLVKKKKKDCNQSKQCHSLLYSCFVLSYIFILTSSLSIKPVISRTLGKTIAQHVRFKTVSFLSRPLQNNNVKSPKFPRSGKRNPDGKLFKFPFETRRGSHTLCLS